MSKTKVGNYYAITVCKQCKKPLTTNQLMNSSGVCPHCGNSKKGTVCDFDKVVIRKVTEYYGFLNLKTKSHFEGADDASKEYIKNLTT